MQPLILIAPSERTAETALSLMSPLYFVVGDGAQVPTLRACDALAMTEPGSPGYWALMRDIVSPLNPVGVVGLGEEAVRIAALTVARFGWRGVPLEIDRVMRDKVAMRTLLAERGLLDLSVEFCIADTGAEAAELIKRTWRDPSGPVVVKPRHGTASRDVRLLSIDLLGSAGDLRESVVEAYVAGTEFSVETFTIAGCHTVAAVVETVVDDATFVELGHVTPPMHLPPDLRERIVETVCRFLDAVGVRDGVCHTEVKVTDGRVRIIESHPRIAGGGITMLVKLTTGVDLVQAALGWVIDSVDEPEVPVAHAAAIAFATARPGVVTDVSLPAPSLPAGFSCEDLTCFVAPGDRVGELRSSGDRAACAMVSGPDSARCLDLARRIVSDVVILTDSDVER